jgi:hypothetical protein
MMICFSMKFEFDEIKWGISKRKDGSMKVIFDGLPDRDALANRKKFFSALGVDHKNVVSADLIHGNRVAIIASADGGRLIPDTDALVTNKPGVYLTVTGADCVPVFFYDPKQKAIGLAHAGWRGVVKNIAAEAVCAMKEKYGSMPSDICALIGPRIQAHHFEVQEDVAERFSDHPDRVQKRDGRIFIDLGRIIFDQLLDAGVLKTNIANDPACTYCEKENYFSFRRDKPNKLQAMVAYIGRR